MSYDVRDALKAQEYGQLRSGGAKRLFDFELDKQNVLNYQVLVKYELSDEDVLSASYAKKSYFASMKERYSERFKRYIPNPYLKPEVAHHMEIGYKKEATSVLLELLIFRSEIKDAIKDTKTGIFQGGNELLQARNIQKAIYQGGELELAYDANESLETGGNYSYIYAHFTGDKNRLVYNLPKHKGYLYTEYMMDKKVGFHIGIEALSSILSNEEEMTTLPGFAVMHLKTSYAPSPSLKLEVGIRNLFDKHYEYKEGYPEEGRVFFGNLRYHF